jgi:hypothetical protein
MNPPPDMGPGDLVLFLPLKLGWGETKRRRGVNQFVETAYLYRIICRDERGCGEFRLPLNVLPRVEGSCEEGGREENFSLKKGGENICPKGCGGQVQLVSPSRSV